MMARALTLDETGRTVESLAIIDGLLAELKPCGGVAARLDAAGVRSMRLMIASSD
jgi:hypothetical protein